MFSQGRSVIYGYISFSKQSYTSRCTRPVLPCIVAGPSGRAFYDRSPAGIVGSNLSAGMDVCLL